MAVHLHLLVLVFILLVPTPQQARGNVSPFSPMDDLSRGTKVVFKVETDDYTDFLNELRGVLATGRTVGTGYLRVPVLPRQRKQDDFPARWIYVNLVGKNADKTTIAVRDDNIYIVGFNNSMGSWFEFEGPPQHLLPGSTWLPFGGGYPDLVKGGRKELTGIKLGKKNMLQAVRMLALHHPNPEKLKVALATLCVMVSEAERFVPIKKRVAQGWNGTPQITAVEANSVARWGDISRALLKWQNTNDWTYKKSVLTYNINRPYDALRTLGLVLGPKPPNDSKTIFDAITADDGKPLADDSSTTCNGTSCN